MHHARAKDFQPIVTLAHFQRAAFPRTTNIDLGRRFGKGKVRGAESQVDAVHLEIGFHELFEHPFQVRHADVFVDGKAFDLVEHRGMCLVVIRAVNAAGADDARRST